MVEKCEDTTPSISCRWLVKPGTGEPSHYREQNSHTMMVIQKGVSGVGILDDIMFDTENIERALESGGCATKHSILGAETADDWTGLAQGDIRICGYPAVIHTRRCELVSWRQLEGEPSPQAESDYADVPGTIRSLSQPGTCRVDVVEAIPSACHQVTKSGDDANHRASPREQVRSKREVPGAS